MWLQSASRISSWRSPPHEESMARRSFSLDTPPKCSRAHLFVRGEVRFDHPQPLVHSSRDLDEDVVGIRVSGAVAVRDGGADRLAERRERGGEGVDLLPAVGK